MKNYKYGWSKECSPAHAFLMAWTIPADQNPDMIIFLPSSVSKKLRIFFNVSKWMGFIIANLRSTEIVITSRFGSLINSFTIVYVKYLPNSFLSMFLNVTFVVRSRGCRRCAKFFRTFTVRMFNSESLFLISLVFWPVNAFQISKDFWLLGRYKFFFVFSI